MTHAAGADQIHGFDQFLQDFAISASDRVATRHSANLLPSLLRACQVNRGYSHFSQPLSERICEGAALSVLRSGCFENRWVWWPRGMQVGRYVAVVSSRIGQSISNQWRWLKTLEAIVTCLDPRRDVLVSLPGTTCHRFWPCLLNSALVPQLNLQKERRIYDVCRTILGHHPADGDIRQAVLSTVQHRSSLWEHRDASMMAFADLLVVTRLTTGGRLFPLVRKVLLTSTGRPQVLLATDAGEIPFGIIEQLVVDGASIWSDDSLISMKP